MATAEVITAKVTDVAYPIHEAKIAEWAGQYLPLTIDDINDSKALAVVHDARMIVKNARGEIEKRRKALKEDSLRYGREVDSVAKYLTSKLEPIEAHLAEQENKVTQEKERIRQAKLEEARALTQARVDALAAVGYSAAFVECETMSQEAYAERLTKATEAYRVTEQEKAAAEAERLRKQAEEDAQRKAESDRLAAERAELARIRQAQDAEAARLAAAQKKIDDAEAAKRRAEEIERARVEAAERSRIETEQRIEREKAEAKAKAAAEEAEAARLAALRPDCDKLNALADALSMVERPKVSTHAAKARAQCEFAIGAAIDTIRGIAKSLAGSSHDD